MIYLLKDSKLHNHEKCSLCEKSSSVKYFAKIDELSKINIAQIFVQLHFMNDRVHYNKT